MSWVAISVPGAQSSHRLWEGNWDRLWSDSSCSIPWENLSETKRMHKVVILV